MALSSVRAWGAFADGLDDVRSVAYADLPGLASTSVEGHAGVFVAGHCKKRPVVVMKGRVHRYEGHSMEQVVLPARAMVMLGCRTIIITNAAGAISEDLEPGDLALITDHINLLGANPLTGPNDERLGERFPDMSAVYDSTLQEVARKGSTAAGVELKAGVYAAMPGPCYETPAEVEMLRRLGADFVGMSTVPEAIAVHHMGARVLGISCIANKAAGLGAPLSHADVQTAAADLSGRFVALLENVIASI